MTRISLGGPSATPIERTEVELWDRLFLTAPFTRSTAQRVSELEARLTEATTDDDAIALFGELLDVVLEPAAGQRKTASAILLARWQADELELAQISAFVSQVQQRAVGELGEEPVSRRSTAFGAPSR